MSTPVVFLFSGKGSQYFHMGFSLYRRNKKFQRHVDRLDEIAKAVTGIQVVDRIFDSVARPLTAITDPELAVLSIFLVECALANTLIDYDVLPSAIITSSMGIYAGAVTAGVLTEEAGFRYLHAASRIFRDACEPGGLIAILGTKEQFASSAVLQAHSVLAAVSLSSHISIAFPVRHEAEIEAELRRLGLSSQVLPISRAYHSHWIDTARRSFLELFAHEQSREPIVPMNCVSANLKIAKFSGEAVWHAIRMPMYFQLKIEHIERQGSWRYVDVGPASSSATLLKYCLPQGTDSTFHPVLSQFGDDEARLNYVLERVVS